MNKFLSYLKKNFVRNSELGGYVHDTAFSQYIPPTAWHFATGTWTMIAGQVAKTIALHKAAADQTTVISIPIMIPSNSVANKGAYLKSVEIDFEIRTAVATSITPLIHLVTRDVEGTGAGVVDQAFTQAPADPRQLINISWSSPSQRPSGSTMTSTSLSNCPSPPVQLAACSKCTPP